MKAKSLLEGSTGLFALAEQHDNPPYKDPEPEGCQALRLARAAENENCKTVMSEIITQKSHVMEKMLDDPDRLLKSIMTDQIVEYRALSGALALSILTSQKNGVIPEELIPIKLKVDSHVLSVAKLNKQLSSPEGQIKIVAPGSQLNFALAQQVSGSATNYNDASGDTHKDAGHDNVIADPLTAVHHDEATSDPLVKASRIDKATGVPIPVGHFNDVAKPVAEVMAPNTKTAPDLF